MPIGIRTERRASERSEHVDRRDEFGWNRDWRNMEVSFFSLLFVVFMREIDV